MTVKIDPLDPKYKVLLASAGLEAETLMEQLAALDDSQLPHAVSALNQWFSAYLNPDVPGLAFKMSQAVGKIVRGEIRLPREEDVKYIWDFIPRIVPVSWVLREERIDGATWRNDFDGSVVIVTAHLSEGDRGKRWIHFSTSNRDRVPTWEELVARKELFLGQQTKAISIIPPRREYVNIHPNVLHLYVCLDGDGLPDFTLGSASL